MAAPSPPRAPPATRSRPRVPPPPRTQGRGTGGGQGEGTAGNTGIGLARVAKASGYGCTIVIPRTQSQEKKDAIRLYGADLVEVDAVPYANEMNYVKYSGRLAQELDAKEPNGAIWANQFDNVANRQDRKSTRLNSSH